MREEMLYNPNFYQLREYMLQTMVRIASENKKSKTHGLLFFGDSITEWYNLEKYYPEIPIKYNSGIAGATSESLRWICDEAVIKYHPHLIVLMIGINDFGNTNMRSPHEIVSNVQILLDLMQRNLPNSKVLLLETLPCDEERAGWLAGKKMRSNKMITVLNEEYEELAKILSGVELVKTFKNFFDEEHNSIYSAYTTDGLHLSEVGYMQLTRSIKPILQKYIDNEV